MFVCSKWSPLETAVWSTGTPPVALTHIFCGQIKDNGKTAEGFHSRPNNKDPTSAKATNYQSIINGLRCYRDEAVFDAKNVNWVPRTPPSSKHFCFFPEAWSITVTVQNIQRIYKYCIRAISNNQICGRNYMGQGFDVIVFLQSGNRVVTSFATPSQEVPCGVQCDLRNLHNYFEGKFS